MKRRYSEWNGRGGDVGRLDWEQRTSSHASGFCMGSQRERGDIDTVPIVLFVCVGRDENMHITSKPPSYTM